MSKYAVFVRGGPVLEIVDRPHELTHIGQQLFIGALGPVGSVCVLPCSDDVAATFGARLASCYTTSCGTRAASAWPS